MPVRSTLTLKLPPRFNLPAAVCSYGYFLLAPNRWDPATQRLHRPLRDTGDRVVHTVIRQRGERLVIAADSAVHDPAGIKRQVVRMLRLHESFDGWFARSATARRRGFARLFRSPSVFEDMVKTITTCNVTWPNTLRMNALLCEHYGGGAFPTAPQLAAAAPQDVQAKCKVGYRAQRIVRLARDVVQGRLDVEAFDTLTEDTNSLFRRVKSLHGFGDFAAANMMQLLGRYDRIPIDSETYRHFRQHHGLPTPRTAAGLRRLNRRIERHYAPFQPFAFLAYWMELWGRYEDHAGDARAWEAKHAGQFTSRVLEASPRSKRH